MRILIVTSAFPPMTGGPSRQALEIRDGLIALGHDAMICTTACTQPSRNLIPLTLSNKSNTIGKIFRYIQIVFGVSRAIIIHRPHVLHNQTFGGPLSLISCLVSRVLNIPTITKITGERGLEMAKEKNWGQKGIKGAILIWLTKQLDRLQILLSSATWSTSPQFTYKLKHEYRKHPSKIFTYPNFTDLSNFRSVAKRSKQTESCLHILTVCRLRPWKGLEYAMEAIYELSDTNLKWTIVGDGPDDYVAKLDKRIIELGLQNQITLRGPMSPDAIHEAYRDAEIFLLPSLYEPFGIVLIEAMAAEVPIVASNTGGIPYVLGRPTAGLMFRSGNKTELAKALNTLHKNPSIKLELIALGNKQVQRFSTSTALNAITRAYTLLSNRHISPNV